MAVNLWNGYLLIHCANTSPFINTSRLVLFSYPPGVSVEEEGYSSLKRFLLQ